MSEPFRKQALPRANLVVLVEILQSLVQWIPLCRPRLDGSLRLLSASKRRVIAMGSALSIRREPQVLAAGTGSQASLANPAAHADPDLGKD